MILEDSGTRIRSGIKLFKKLAKAHTYFYHEFLVKSYLGGNIPNKENTDVALLN